MIDRPWCPAWGIWFNSNGTDPVGEEPPEGHWIWDIWDIWDQDRRSSPTRTSSNKLFEGIMDIWAEEMPQIGYLGESPTPIIVKNGFTELPERATRWTTRPATSTCSTPRPTSGTTQKRTCRRSQCGGRDACSALLSCSHLAVHDAATGISKCGFWSRMAD